VRCPLDYEPTAPFLGLPLVIPPNCRTPFSVAAEPFDRHKVKVLERARIEVRPHRLVHVFVAPAKTLLASEQIAANPALLRLDFDAISREGSAPHGPKHTGEDAAPVAVGEACRLDDHSLWRRSLPILSSFCDEFPA
jgi:hypothetical protein